MDARRRCTQHERRAGRPLDDDGFSLLELVIALGIFALVVGAVASTISSGLNLTRNNRNRSIAANLAAEEMDRVRSADFTTLAAAVTTREVDGVPYSVHRELTWIPRDATNGPCDGNNANPELLRVRVWVDWPAMRGVQPAESDTVLSPPVGAYDAATGHIAVKVLNRNAGPSANRVVNLTGTTVRSTITNSDGCAFFAFLPAGNYTVTLASSGYVDRQGTASPAQGTSVTVGQVTSMQFDYDRAAALDLTLDSGDAAVPSAVPVTIGYSQLLPSGRRTITGSGTSRLLTDLFPTVEGYTAWAGGCAAADPEGVDPDGVAYWPGAMRAEPIPTVRGGTTDATVGLPSVEIEVVDTGDAPIVGASVVATHAADFGCPAGESYTLGTTDDEGELAAALPYGTWTFSVAGSTPASSWPEVPVPPDAPASVEVVVQ